MQRTQVNSSEDQNATTTAQVTSVDHAETSNCRSAIADSPLILTGIFEPQHNIVVWQRALQDPLAKQIDADLSQGMQLQIAAQVNAEEAQPVLGEKLAPYQCGAMLSADIAQLVDMFTVLFECPTVGLRLATMDQAMCPRFHVDRVGCRLVTTYSGFGTEWLNDSDVDRTKLGARDANITDIEAGLFHHAEQVNCARRADVVLLKGSRWEGNEDHAVVHRSPTPKNHTRRLFLSLDVIAD